MGLLSAEERKLLGDVLTVLGMLPDHLRQTLSDHLWSSTPQYVMEQASNAALVAGTALTCNPQTENLELIQSMLIAVPSGATGTVVVGDVTIFTPAGLFAPSGLSIPLTKSGKRQITIAGANGAAALVLMGVQLPTNVPVLAP